MPPATDPVPASWSSFIDDLGAFAARTVIEGMHRMLGPPADEAAVRRPPSGPIVIAMMMTMIALVVVSVLLARRGRCHVEDEDTTPAAGSDVTTP